MSPRPSRRDRILAIAADRFAARGYDGTSIGDLASELDVSKAAISHHFPAKADLAHALLGPFLDDLDAAVDAPTPEALLAAYLAAIARHHDLARWLDRDPALRSMPSLGGRLAAANEAATAALAASDAPEDHVRALAALGAVWRPALASDTATIIDHADLIVDAALAGLAAG